jgi:hypothetical protein
LVVVLRMSMPGLRNTSTGVHLRCSNCVMLLLLCACRLGSL